MVGVEVGGIMVTVRTLLVRTGGLVAETVVETETGRLLMLMVVAVVVAVAVAAVVSIIVGKRRTSGEPSSGEAGKRNPHPAVFALGVFVEGCLAHCVVMFSFCCRLRFGYWWWWWWGWWWYEGWVFSNDCFVSPNGV